MARKAAKKAIKPKTKRTTRIGKTDRVPKTRATGTWSEAAFFGFLRSGLRRMSRRWPPLVAHAVNAVRRMSQSDNKRLKWEFQCQTCQDWFARKDIEVDHIEPCGSLRTLGDLQGFVSRLFCEIAGLRVSCTTCHKARHDAERASDE